MSELANYKTAIDTEITLHDLARTGDIETFQTISLDKFDINGKDADGYSALMISACRGHREFSRYLLGLGANPNSIDNSGSSVLMWAAYRGHHEIIKHLIENGADVSHTNSQGQSALDLAEEFNRVEAINILKSYQQKPQAFNFLTGLKNWASILKFKRV